MDFTIECDQDDRMIIDDEMGSSIYEGVVYQRTADMAEAMRGIFQKFISDRLELFERFHLKNRPQIIEEIAKDFSGALNKVLLEEVGPLKKGISYFHARKMGGLHS